MILNEEHAKKTNRQVCNKVCGGCGENAPMGLFNFFLIIYTIRTKHDVIGNKAFRRPRLGRKGEQGQPSQQARDVNKSFGKRVLG